MSLALHFTPIRKKQQDPRFTNTRYFIRAKISRVMRKFKVLTRLPVNKKLKSSQDVLFAFTRISLLCRERRFHGANNRSKMERCVVCFPPRKPWGLHPGKLRHIAILKMKFSFFLRNKHLSNTALSFLFIYVQRGQLFARTVRVPFI